MGDYALVKNEKNVFQMEAFSNHCSARRDNPDESTEQRKSAENLFRTDNVNGATNAAHAVSNVQKRPCSPKYRLELPSAEVSGNFKRPIRLISPKQCGIFTQVNIIKFSGDSKTARIWKPES